MGKAWNGGMIREIVEHTLEVSSADKYEVMQMLDYHPTVNMKCITLVGGLNKSRKKGESGALPSQTSISRALRDTHDFCDIFLPTEEIPNVPFSCQFKPKEFFQQALMTKDLHDLLSSEDGSVSINVKCDGFPLTKYTSGVYLSIIFNDARVCPGTVVWYGAKAVCHLVAISCIYTPSRD